MRVMKILLCGLLMAMPVFAEETEDRQTATSLRYVSHELDTRQDKLSTGSNKALTYTNSAGDIEQRTVKSDLTGGTTDTSLPQVNAVNAGLNQKQDDIGAINDHTAVTYTEQTGVIGQKGIYQDSGTYIDQADNLIDAKTFNAALKNGLDSEFVCGGTSPNGTCWLWQIHNTYNATAQPYISATGTGVQDGTPTPTNPIYPVFYRQGDMVLRKVGDYADSYDATTRKITRRVGVKVFNGTESWGKSGLSQYYYRFLISGAASNWGVKTGVAPYCTHVPGQPGTPSGYNECGFSSRDFIFHVSNEYLSVPEFKQWITEQYAAGTPVTVWYPLETPVEEDWPATTYNENVYIPQNQQ